MKEPKIAILDGDIIAYRVAFWAETEGIDEIPYRVYQDIQEWTPGNIDEIIVAMSCPRENNFRRDFWPLYKKHRDASRIPDALLYTIETIYETSDRDNIQVRCVDRLEADDLIGMMVSAGKAVGITIDKDLKQIPGWHMNPDKDGIPHYISEEEADAFFYEQWMAGDSTDNIWGLWRVGPKKARKILKEVEKKEWDGTIMEAYASEDWDKRPENRIPDMSKEEYALAQARCVRILRHGDYNKKTKEISLWSPDNLVYSKSNNNIED